WAEARHRETGICQLKILRAQEELQRLNIEVKRLATWIVNDEASLDAAITKCQGSDPLLAKAMMGFTAEQKRVNRRVQATLHNIYDLDGYSG
ncbi:hypothetical protein JB92DRAFT_2542778, partial [Gautieria morchelliformis]